MTLYAYYYMHYTIHAILYYIQGDAPIDDIALGQTPIGGGQLGTEGPYQEYFYLEIPNPGAGRPHRLV